MAAVSLFWATKMAAVTSCENTTINKKFANHPLFETIDKIQHQLTLALLVIQLLKYLKNL